MHEYLLTQHTVGRVWPHRNASDPPDEAIMKLQGCYYPSLQVGRAGLLVPALPAVIIPGTDRGAASGEGLQGWDCRQGHFTAYICLALGSLERDSGIRVPVKVRLARARRGWGAEISQGQCPLTPEQGQKGWPALLGTEMRAPS